MTSEFIPYDLALRLKALGFDEPCMASRDMGNGNGLIQIPIYQQAFRWFREKYNLFGKVYIVNFGADEYSFDVYDLYEEKYKYENFIGASASYTGTFETYEEAELACLKKLIEIVESKQK
jgi:hypothetical protein